MKENAKIFHFYIGIPNIDDDLAYIRNEENPGPKHIPAAPSPTKRAVYFDNAHGFTFNMMYFLVINLAPPIPIIILPIAKMTTALVYSV